MVKKVKTSARKPAPLAKPVAAPKPTAKKAAIAKPGAKAQKAKRLVGPLNIPALPPAAPPTPGTPSGSAEAYQTYLPLAQQIPSAKVPPYRQDPALAYKNVTTALAALAPHDAELSQLPAPFSHDDLQALPAIGLATIYAAAQVNLSSPGTVKTLQKTVAGLRDLMLSSAVTLMKAGVLSAPDVQRIVKGKGASDMAQDCVDLAVLFTKNASAVAGKTPVTQAHIDEASQAGNQLLTVLTPKAAPAQKLSKKHPAVAARDALGALLVQQYEAQARRAGMWIWTDDVDAHVPALHSHHHAKKKAAPVNAPPPPVKPVP